VLAVASTVVGCAGGQPTGEPAPEPAAAAPLAGDNYAFVYVADGDIRQADTRVGPRDRILAQASQVLLAVPSPDGRRVAVALRRGTGDAVRVFDAESGSVREVYGGAAGASFTMQWSTDGARLGVGVRGGGRAGIVVLEAGGSVRDIGCRASDRFVVWRRPTEAVVQDGTNFYVVRTSDCATVATIGRAGMRDPEYSRGGTTLSYYQDRSVKVANRVESELIPELWIARYDGAGARVIADYQSRPRNSAWSPDGERIVYEVVSRRWANTTHLVTYEPDTDAYEYIAKEMDLGVPNDFGACWSPDGSRFAHDRTYARSTGTRSYTTRQVVVRNGTDEKTVFDEVIDAAPAQVVADPPARCRWMDARYLLVDTRQGQHVVDVEDGETYRLPADRRVLAVRVFERTR
jgi:hypothetical protein